MAFGNGDKNGAGGNGFRPTFGQVITILMILANVLFFGLVAGGKVEKFDSAANTARDHDKQIERLQKEIDSLRLQLHRTKPTEWDNPHWKEMQRNPIH